MTKISVIYEDDVPCIKVEPADDFAVERNAEDDLLMKLMADGLKNGLVVEELNWGYLIRAKEEDK